MTKKNTFYAELDSIKRKHPEYYLIKEEDNEREVDQRRTAYMDGFAMPLPIKYALGVRRDLRNEDRIMERDDFGTGYILTNKNNKEVTDMTVRLYRMITALELLTLYKVVIPGSKLPEIINDPDLCLETIQRFMPSVSHCLEAVDSSCINGLDHTFPVRHGRSYAAMLDPNPEVRKELTGYSVRSTEDGKVVTMDDPTARIRHIANDVKVTDDSISDADLYYDRYSRPIFDAD